MKTIVSFCALLLAAVVASGQGWEWQNPLPQGHDLRAVRFLDGANGWAVGDEGTILHTTDGGSTWEVQSSGVMLKTFNKEVRNV